MIVELNIVEKNCKFILVYIWWCNVFNNFILFFLKIIFRWLCNFFYNLIVMLLILYFLMILFIMKSCFCLGNFWRMILLGEFIKIILYLFFLKRSEMYFIVVVLLILEFLVIMIVLLVLSFFKIVFVFWVL